MSLQVGYRLASANPAGVAVSRPVASRTVTVNDGDAPLSVTRIHPVVMLQADRKSLLLWARVTLAAVSRCSSVGSPLSQFGVTAKVIFE